MKSITEYKEGELILQCAFCYALGRSTYVVVAMVETILNEWENLKPGTKIYFIKLIKEAIKNNRAGMDMDIKQWQRILDHVENMSKTVVSYPCQT